MSESKISGASNPVEKLLKHDPRYRIEAYQFVREALSYAQDMLRDCNEEKKPAEETERHLTGQQLCEAIRQYGLKQFGFMTPVVLKNWGVTSTSDFGEIVYNLIEIGFMKKSADDRREDFDGVYEFEDAFRNQFRIEVPE